MMRPCLGCERRKPACHDSCPDYQATKAAAAAVKAERDRQYGGEAADYERHMYETRKNWRRR